MEPSSQLWNFVDDEVYYSVLGRKQAINAYHGGIDLPNGGNIYATADGTCTGVWWNNSRGNVIATEHSFPFGKQVVFAHSHTKGARVSRGDDVTAGNKICSVETDSSKNGTATGIHDHVEAVVDQGLINGSNSSLKNFLVGNPYYNGIHPSTGARKKLTPSEALKYASYSLVTDDWHHQLEVPIEGGKFNNFRVWSSSSSWLAYVVDNDTDRSYTISEAVDAEIISSYGVLWKNPDNMVGITEVEIKRQSHLIQTKHTPSKESLVKTSLSGLVCRAISINAIEHCKMFSSQLMRSSLPMCS